MVLSFKKAFRNYSLRHCGTHFSIFDFQRNLPMVSNGINVQNLNDKILQCLVNQNGSSGTYMSRSDQDPS
jgi:hypothetical protein